MLSAGKVGTAPGTTTIYWPYATDYRGLGVIDPGDMWPTGRPYGLPGTATIRLPPGLSGLGQADEETPWWKTGVFIGSAMLVGGSLLGFLAGWALKGD